MAVENCTISTVSITALGGSTLVAGTKTLVITPDADFYVSASMCLYRLISLPNNKNTSRIKIHY